jgi:hypothetical protein
MLPPFHGENRGSIPLGRANKINSLNECRRFVCLVCVSSTPLNSVATMLLAADYHNLGAPRIATGADSCNGSEFRSKSVPYDSASLPTPR